VSLTSTRTTIVTVNVAGKTATVTVNLNARTGISITAPATAIAAGTPVTFTIGVGAAPAVNIRDVSVDFGDGARSSLGAISTTTPVQHIYLAEGTYRASATATEASGFTETVATFVTILPQQPPGVVIQATPTSPRSGDRVVFTAVVTGATSTILRYEWAFDGGFPPTAVTTGNQASSTFSNADPNQVQTRVITVRVIQSLGPAGEGTTAIRVGPPATVR
jgi:hypothetical protein